MFKQSRLSTINQSARLHLNEIKLHNAHETAICPNPPTNKFCRRCKKLYQSLTDQHLTVLSFYENIRTSNFFVGTTF